MNPLIVAGEASGDLYGGKLAFALKQRLSNLHLAGMGGDKMSAAGVELLYNYRKVSVVGTFEVLSKLSHLRQAYSLIKRWILENKPEFAILIDFPDFNFRIASFLKKHGVKTFYFVSPQVWAWRKNRIFFLKDHVDLMITVLPFEQQIYRNAGIPVTYVGHPLVQIVNEELSKQPEYPRQTPPLVGIMPGSRSVEVQRHLKILVETILLIQRKIKVKGLVIWPPSLPVEKYKIPAQIDVVLENRYAAMKACDLLLVASGTSTLEAAILGVPLFIVYRVSWLSWQVGKLLVRVPYYGLVNWIAGKMFVPEYIQNRMDASLLAADTIRFLKDDREGRQMRMELVNVVRSLHADNSIEHAVAEITNRLV